LIDIKGDRKGCPYFNQRTTLNVGATFTVALVQGCPFLSVAITLLPKGLRQLAQLKTSSLPNAERFIAGCNHPFT
jgi:hypothetical protein